MMVMWSKHYGKDDRSGRRCVDYFLSGEVHKSDAEGRRRVRREPPPELLAGDPDQVVAAIEVLEFERKYTSCVLSFEQNDIDVSKFNSGDPELRRRVSDIIERFEELAFAGLDREAWPPTLWATHTHTGRLELNFLCPRATLSAGRVRSFNPSPPGRQNQDAWDSLRDYLNFKYGMADPEDPTRRRSVKVPDHLAKTRAEAARAGELGEPDLRETLDDLIWQGITDGTIQNRDAAIAALTRAGFTVSRKGENYVTFVDPDSGRRCRLKGAAWSQSFRALGDLAGDLERRQGQGRGDRDRALRESADRLKAAVEKRAAHTQKKYGVHERRARALLRQTTATGPAPNGLDLDDRHRDPNGRRPDIARDQSGAQPGYPGRNQRTGTDSSRAQAGGSRFAGSLPSHPEDGRIPGANIYPSGPGPAPLYRRGGRVRSAAVSRRRASDFRQQFFAQLYAGVPVELQIHVAWIDIAERKYSLDDGSHVWDQGSEIATDANTATSVATVFAIAQAKGWSKITVEGTEDFKLAVWLEAQRRGIEVTNYQPPAAVAAAVAGAAATASSLPIVSPSEFQHVASTATSHPTRTGTTGNDHQDGGKAGAAGQRAGGVVDEFVAAADQFGAAVRRSTGRLEHDQRRRQWAEELDHLKRSVDIRVILQELGYIHDPRSSSKNHWVARNAANGRKLIVTRAPSGHWVWNDNQDKRGSAIDFLVSEGFTFGDAVRALKGQAQTMSASTGETLVKAASPEADLAAEWAALNKNKASAYLLNRGIRGDVMLSDRFKGCWAVDARNNAVFPYSIVGKLSGLERRNRPAPGSDHSFKAYSTGGKPGLWQSRTSKSDKEIVIVESPIDAMAHYQLCDPSRRQFIRYIAIRNGTPENAILDVIGRAPLDAKVTIATDSDVAGDTYFKRLSGIMPGERKIRRERPASKDWTADIQEKKDNEFQPGSG